MCALHAWRDVVGRCAEWGRPKGHDWPTGALHPRHCTIGACAPKMSQNFRNSFYMGLPLLRASVVRMAEGLIAYATSCRDREAVSFLRAVSHVPPLFLITRRGISLHGPISEDAKCQLVNSELEAGRSLLYTHGQKHAETRTPALHTCLPYFVAPPAAPAAPAALSHFTCINCMFSPPVGGCAFAKTRRNAQSRPRRATRVLPVKAFVGLGSGPLVFTRGAYTCAIRFSMFV